MAEEKKQHHHVMISASYEASKAVESRFLSSVIRGALLDSHGDRVVHKIVAYQMPYAVSPMSVGLKDMWDKMGDEERLLFSIRYPKIATAIILMMGVENGEFESPGKEIRTPVEPEKP
jgi:hypothetical protein